MHKQYLPVRGGLAANKIGLTVVAVILAALVAGGFSTASIVNAAPTGLPQFQEMWDRSDKPVEEGRAGRSWTWGPALAGLETEPYTQGGTRKIQYFDKARMELTEGRAVTNGLLAKEMITGLMQMGDNDFEQYEVNGVLNIAGDQGAFFKNPTYASFRKVATINNENRMPNATGQYVTGTINRDGSTGRTDAFNEKYNVRQAYYDNTLSHNIPNVFWDFMNATGLVFKNGQYMTDKVFDWMVAIGLPLTEAYWSRSMVKGVEQDVLVQAFERRVLTYTPSNPDPFKVEMGNVGQHYRDWRANPQKPAPEPTPTPPPPTATPTPPPATPVPTTPPPASGGGGGGGGGGPVETPPPVSGTPAPVTNLPAASGWTAPVKLGSNWRSFRQRLNDPSLRVNPVTGVAYIVGSTGSGTTDTISYDQIGLVKSDNPATVIDINDDPSGGFLAHLTFAPDGSAYVAWVNNPGDRGLRAYMRKINPDGSMPPGFSLPAAFGSDKNAYLSQPDLDYSAKTGLIYVVGQVQKAGAPLGFGIYNPANGSWSGQVEVQTSRPDGVNVNPRICVDKNTDDVHIAYSWGEQRRVISRVGGVWQRPLVMGTPGPYSIVSITCGDDGYAYAAYDSYPNSTNSFGLARYIPGQGWQLVSSNVFRLPSVGISLAATPTGRLYAVMGVSNGGGTVVAYSDDRGSNWSQPQTVIQHANADYRTDVDYSVKDGKIWVVGTFEDPSDSWITSTK